MKQIKVAKQPDALCNMDFLLESLAGNRAMADRLAGLFLDTYPDLIRQLDEARTDGDLAALRKIVHNIRGSCVMFSVLPCLALAGKLEDQLPDRPGIDLADDCVRLRGLLEDMATELRRFLSRN